MCLLPTEAYTVTKLQRELFMATLILLILLASFGTCFPLQRLPRVSSEPSNVFFYHNRSETYRNENESIFMFDGADIESPLGTDAARVLLRCAIMRQIQYLFSTYTAYVGVVQWTTPPLSEDYIAGGTVTMFAWLSSEDVAPQISGYGMAIADLDENGDVIGDLFYNYNYATGKAISTNPTEYTISVNINHVFLKNHRLAFEVIVGSTTQGWTANVYFDSPDRNSRAVLPGNPVVVPELKHGASVLAMTVMVAATFLICRKKLKHTLKREIHLKSSVPPK